jgi:DUF3072 family protein
MLASSKPVKEETMTDDQRSRPTPDGRPGLVKDPEEWVSGDEPMTGAQASYLETLARQAGEEIETAGLTKAEASEKIDELRGRAGVGQERASGRR